MLHFLSMTKTSFGIVDYDHQSSIDIELFQECTSLKDLASKVPISYKLVNKLAIQKITKFHLVGSTGPTLVSNAFRNVIEKIGQSEIEFLDVSILFEDQKIDGFSCIHPLLSIECMDMQKSEYKQTNFDPRNPTYMFLYMHLLEHPDAEPHVARCAEYRGQMVVDDEVKKACFLAKLKGLAFYRALDMTYNNRTVGEVI